MAIIEPFDALPADNTAGTQRDTHSQGRHSPSRSSLHLEAEPRRTSPLPTEETVADFSWITREFDKSRQDEERKENERKKERKKKSKEAIFSSYYRHVVDEDRELVEGWNENLNILLTFAGLLSAVITAFILQAGVSLQSSPADTTNALLFSLLVHFDPSITTSPPSVDNSTTTIQVSAWWYASLCCSLLSAFGGLVTKQWIIRYRKTATWADTIVAQCRLRELRYEGLVEWRFFGIMEVLPLLLQLSLLLFAIGLVQVLWSQSRVVASIVVASMVIGGLFYATTLVCGILFTRCPFKSPVTDFIYILGRHLLLYVVFFCFTVVNIPYLIWRRFFPVPISADGLRAFWRESWHFVLTINWSSSFTHYIDDRRLNAMAKRGDAGVYVWALRRDGIQVDVIAAEEILEMQQSDTAMLFRSSELVDDWATHLDFHPSLSSDTSDESFRLAGDVLFHLLDQTPLFRYQLIAYFDAAALERDLRRIWTLDSAKGLVFADMRRSTAFAYCHAAFLSLCSGAMYFDTRAALNQEMKVWLPNLLTESPHLLAGVVALSSLLLVPKNTHKVEDQLDDIAYLGVGETILVSLERLATYKGSDNLLPLVLGLPHFGNLKYEMRAEHRWKTGKASRDLMCLARMSRSWPDSSLQDSVLEWLNFFADADDVAVVSGLQDLDTLPIALSTINPNSIPRELAANFDMYNDPTSIIRINFLDVALGLRYFQVIPPKSPYRLRRSALPSITMERQELEAFSILLNDPYTLEIMTGVLSYENHKMISLIISILVKGKALFISEEATTKYPSLVEEIDALQGKVVRSGRPWQQLWVGYQEFTQHKAAISMLKELSRRLKEAASQIRLELRSSAGKGSEVHCSIITFFGIGSRDLLV